MELFDTHAHVYDKRFDNDREQVLSDVFAHLKYVVCPSENLETSRKTTDLVNRYPRLYGAVGIHPHETCHATEDSLQELESVARENHKIVAIGEIGLDYHYFYSDKEMQQKWFHRQIELAGKLDLPIIIHDRDAHGDTLRILREHKRDSLRGILHCYSGRFEMAKEFIRLGFYISFAGPVVFPKSTKLKQVAKGIPLNRLLIETDSPYLAPPPHRGERNTPRNVIYVAEEIARLKDLSVEAVVFIKLSNKYKQAALCESNRQAAFAWGKYESGRSIIWTYKGQRFPQIWNIPFHWDGYHRNTRHYQEGRQLKNQ